MRSARTLRYMSSRPAARALGALLLVSAVTAQSAVSASASAGTSGFQTTWSSPATGVSAQHAGSDDQQLVLSPDGHHAAAVWIDGSTPSSLVQFASATIAGNVATWSAPSALTADGWSSSARVRLSSDGTRATAVWTQQVSGRWVVRTASATIALGVPTWGTTRTLSDENEDAHNPRIGMSQDGAAITAVWWITHGGREVAETRSGTVTGNESAWNAGEYLSTPSEKVSDDVELAVSDDGSRAVAAWCESQSGNWCGEGYGALQTKTASITGGVATWSSAPQTLTTGFSVQSLRVAMTADGTGAAAMWQHGGNGALEVASATVSGTTSSWGSVLAIVGADAPTFSAELALSADGHRIGVAWSAWDQVAAVFRAKAVVGNVSGTAIVLPNPIKVLDTGLTHSSAPRLALSADGSRGLVQWKVDQENGPDLASYAFTATDAAVIWDDSSALIGQSPSSFGDFTPQLQLSRDGKFATSSWYDGSMGAVYSASAVIGVPPAITSVAPTSGPVAGGTVITITGTGLDAGTVTVGGTTCVVATASSTTITCTTPGGTAGAVAVAVTTGDGTASSAAAFTYTSSNVCTGKGKGKDRNEKCCSLATKGKGPYCCPPPAKGKAPQCCVPPTPSSRTVVGKATVQARGCKR